MSDRFPVVRNILTYILYPELRLKEFFIRWHIARFLTVSFITLFFLLVAEILSYEIRIEKVRHKLSVSEEMVHLLNTNARVVVYKEVRDSFLWSGDYLRYIIFKKTGMTIPARVSDAHLAAMVAESESRGIPMKLMFRVIKHESSFDSSALNPTSGAWGYMQTVNGTFNWYYGNLGLTGGRTLANNIKVGAQRLKDGYDYWKVRKRKEEECWELALACYSVGDSLPRAIDGVPDCVKDYINYVMYSDK